MQSVRDAIRSKVFSVQPKTKTVTFNGVEVEIRQPPVKAILDSSNLDDKRAAIVRLIINYTYIPGTGERVFDEADYDGILEMPFGPDWMSLSSAIDELVDINKQVKEQEKN